MGKGRQHLNGFPEVPRQKWPRAHRTRQFARWVSRAKDSSLHLLAHAGLTVSLSRGRSSYIICRPRAKRKRGLPVQKLRISRWKYYCLKLSAGSFLGAKLCVTHRSSACEAGPACGVSVSMWVLPIGVCLHSLRTS